MINKEEREFIEKLQKGDKIGIYELIRTFKREGIENFITTRRKYIDIMVDLIDKQEDRIKELEADSYEQNNIINNYIEIEKEHQKLNGELQKQLTYYENICKGKSLQELGLSDLYLEGRDGKNN